MQITRHIDELGRVILPSEMRSQLGLQQQDSVTITLAQKRIVIEKTERHCYLCGAQSDLADVGGLSFCLACRQMVGNLRTGDQCPCRNL